MAPQTPAAELARRLIERKSHRGNDPAGAVQAACEDLCRDLARWVGPDGCRGLLARALDLATREHPLLSTIRVSAEGTPRLAGVREAAEAGGSGPAAASLEALLVELIALLSRFIGEDMVQNLIDRSAQAAPEDGMQEGES
jgi:hypothetical protein